MESVSDRRPRRALRTLAAALSLLWVGAMLACGGLADDTPPPPPPVMPSPTGPGALPPPVAPTPPPPPPGVGSAPPPGTVAATLFDGDIYQLAHHNVSEQGVIDEYVPVGETLQRWTKMVAVRRLPRGDAMAAARQIAQNLEAQRPRRTVHVATNPDGRVMLDFVTWEGPITEMNIFILQREPGGQSVLSHQIARRTYDVPRQRAVSAFNADRDRLTGLAGSFGFPPVQP